MCLVFDVFNVCSGFIYVFDVVICFVVIFDWYVFVIGVDVCLCMFDFVDKKMMFFYGDGVGVVVVSRLEIGVVVFGFFVSILFVDGF